METLDTLQNLPLSVAVTLVGHPNPIKFGTVTWSVDNSSVATVAPGPDGYTAILTTASPGNVTVTALVGGINQSLAVTVTDPVVFSVVLTAGTPVDK